MVDVGDIIKYNLLMGHHMVGRVWAIHDEDEGREMCVEWYGELDQDGYIPYLAPVQGRAPKSKVHPCKILTLDMMRTMRNTCGHCAERRRLFGVD